MTQRPVIISCDGHATGRPADYVPYIDPAYRERYAEFRTRVLEQEGIVGEVLFPNGGVPFGGFGESAEHELRAVGNRAYDRWLLAFANDLPGRRAALAMLTMHHLDATVAEIRWAAKSGMKGVHAGRRPPRTSTATMTRWGRTSRCRWRSPPPP